MKKVLVINPSRKHDYLASSVIEGLLKLNIELYFTSTGNGATNIITDAEFITHSYDCDYIVAIWGKSIYNGIPEPKYYLINKVNGWDKTIFIDGSEYNYTGFPNKSTELLHPLFANNAFKYYKRECLPHHVLQGVVPLPFCAIDKDFGNYTSYKKDIDIFCSFGQTSTGLRSTAINVCSQLKSEGYVVELNLSSNYLESLNRAYITIDAHGGGECNARMWQVMANNSCLFAQEYNIVIPNLTKNEHYISWKTDNELYTKLKYYLNNKHLLDTIISNSYKNLIVYHTSLQRAKQIINT